MEISPLHTVTDLEKDNLFSRGSQESKNLPDPQMEEAAENTNKKGDECDYLVFETEVEKGRGALGGNGGEKEEVGGRVETEGEDETREEVEGEEDGRGGVEGDIQQGREMEIEAEQRGRVEGDDRKREESENYDLRKRDVEGEDEIGEGTNDVDKWITGILGEMQQDASSDTIFINEKSGLSTTTSDLPEFTLLEAWSHDLDNREDLSDSHLSDCLQVEMAVVYSDSDLGEDQLPVLPAYEDNAHSKGNESITDNIGNKESMNEDSVAQTEELKVEKVEMDEPKEKKSGVTEESEEHMKSRRDIFLRSPSVSSTASSTDPDKKVPLDFCVQQDSFSENVSTEHLDFLVARQQWKKMEEEVKGLPIPKPAQGAKGSFQGTHSSLYPPTRSPSVKHREIHPPISKEPPLSSTLSPGSEDSGLDDYSFRSPQDEPESAVEREIRLTLGREEQHRRERGVIAQGLTVPRLSNLGTGQYVPRPPVCRASTLSVSPSPSSFSSSLPRSTYHEMTANNVIILEPDSSSSRNRLLSSAIGGFSDWSASLDVIPSANVIVVETSNLIIRSASEFCLSSGPPPVETQESTFSSNPFFKLRSISSQSLVEQEIKMVRQREEEWRRQRQEMWRRKQEEEWSTGREKYDTVLVSPSLNENITFSVPLVPDRSVSSPPSPSRPRKMECSSFSSDHKSPLSQSSVSRRQNTMAQRWEASLLANQKKDSELGMTQIPNRAEPRFNAPSFI